MSLLTRIMQTLNGKEKSYREFVESKETVDELREIVAYIQKDDFLLHSDNFIKDYFRQCGLENSEDVNVDALSLIISEEIDRREEKASSNSKKHSTNKPKATEIVERKIKRKELEDMMVAPNVGIDDPLKKIDDYKEPIEDVCKLMYELLEKRPEHSAILFKVKLPELSSTNKHCSYANLYFLKKNNSILFGMCSSKMSFWPHSSRYSYHGIEAVVTKKQKLFSKKINYSVKLRWCPDHSSSYGSKRDYECNKFDYQITDDLLGKLKSTILTNDDSKIKKYILNIKLLFRFPEMYKQGFEDNKDRIKKQTSGLMESINVAKKYADHYVKEKLDDLNETSGTL
ncbi:hypothetical protein HOK51_05095 [Candidatus Woesearchaeota archaeon]|jgi:hypothetical protein|nr:hypothetical protein [Candidatus Woesearchaeota archaeon]MBT6519203.1 hypothetical protein [Candidatus Woesearchaeota archaeon]MBT7367779.1 hypothetical protein [Candidatus Woesearchaeota archaeon]